MIWHKETSLPKTDLIVIPGGFSYGDYLRSGAIAGKSLIIDEVIKFANNGCLILGICNGFQILTETGLLKGTLLRNKNLKFINKDQNIVACMARIARFYKHESCGQCTPCREGSGWMWRILDRAAKGNATVKDIDLLSDVTKQIEGHTICAFGEGSAWPVQGLLRHFRKEIDKKCINEPILKTKKNIPYLVDQHLLEKKNA